MNNPITLANVRNITVSGRIGSGATTLAKSLAKILNWELVEGGDLFEKIHKELNLDQAEVQGRPDHFDLEYEERIKKQLREDSNLIIQSHLAGYDAQGIEGVFKILVLCVDNEGNDKTEIRIDRLVNRDGKSVEDAKKEVLEREREHLEKFRRLYAGGDRDWVYWDKSYYDLVINTFSNNEEASLKIATAALKI